MCSPLPLTFYYRWDTLALAGQEDTSQRRCGSRCCDDFPVENWCRHRWRTCSNGGTCLQGVVDLRFREGRVGADRHPPALGLLPLNLRHQQRVPVVGTVDVTGTQLRRQTVAVVGFFVSEPSKIRARRMIQWVRYHGEIGNAGLIAIPSRSLAYSRHMASGPAAS